jgi:hypothetical protein
MYGSYGSYSSMCSMSAPLDITSSNLRAHDDACAFPSWPRRSSLSDSDCDAREQRATSFLSDDDLLFLSDPFEDDASSTGGSSHTGSFVSSPPMAMPGASSHPPQFADAEVAAMERERLALQRDYVRQVMLEKEREQRRRQQQQLARRQFQQSQRQRSPKKSSPRSKLSAMTPINEAVIE